MTLTVRIVSDVDEFLGLRDAWNSLASASADGTVFYRHEWFESVFAWRCRDRQLRVVCVERDGQLVGAGFTLSPELQARAARFAELGETALAGLTADPMEFVL